MSDRDDRSEFLRALTDEAREHLTPERMTGKELDWSAVDDALFARLAAEPAPAAARGGLRLLPAAAIASVLALAASAMFVIGHHESPSPGAYKPVTAADSVADASSFLRQLGQGEVRIGGRLASADSAAHVGDTVTVDGGGRAVFVRNDGDARVATWSLANGGTAQARARLVTEEGALVVALEEGAVEAEVRASNRGAFAVDVGRSRVSVKGTHLRVERHGNKVSVDLTQGVVSVGSTSSFAGTLISAPAHVELDTEHPEALDVDRVHVRPAESFEEQTAVLAPTPAFDPASADPKTHGNPVAPPSAPAKSAPTLDAPPEVDPRTRILAGVRNCVLTHGDGAVGSSGSGVAVSVSSKLDLTLDATGAVRSARFSPPLHPDAQSCAAEIIYKVRFDGGATSVSLPIDVKR